MEGWKANLSGQVAGRLFLEFKVSQRKVRLKVDWGWFGFRSQHEMFF